MIVVLQLASTLPPDALGTLIGGALAAGTALSSLSKWNVVASRLKVENNVVG